MATLLAAGGRDGHGAPVAGVVKTLAVAMTAVVAAATVSTDLTTTPALLVAGVVVSLLSAVVLAPVAAWVVVHLVDAC